MEIKLTVPCRPLLALRELAGKKDVRFYINGVCVELDGAGGGVMVATNGHVIGAYRLDGKTCDVPPVKARFIIPRTILDGLKPSPLHFALTATREGERWMLTLDGGTGRVSDLAIEGEFPQQWRANIPHAVSGEAAQFTTAALGMFQKASAALHGGRFKPLTIGHNGPTSAALVDLGDADFCGVMMPARYEAPTAPPAWLCRGEVQALAA